jgi:hypothetical protein
MMMLVLKITGTRKRGAEVNRRVGDGPDLAGLN